MLIKIKYNYPELDKTIKIDWKMRDAIQRYDPFQYVTWDQYSFLWWRS